ncbi:MAG: energy-coupling factor ABC transporter ATP-binding protein [Candidatus Lokiarchaeota archaeon]|nr:energy-coupling factor ABC transporter ATP-binding protein [Candidatus Harpocratesius repetitus]
MISTSTILNPIECQDFSFIYKTSKQLALNKINIIIEPKKFYLLAGPTGSGKTSLIRAINGLIPHFYHGRFFGYVKIKGIDSIDSSPAQLSKHVGTVFQNPENQLFSMSVERELTFALENLGYSRQHISAQINKAIKLTKIENLLNRSPYELSGGEQQRVAIASILALNPEIIVLDEPLSSLDPLTASDIMHLLVQLQQDEGKTIIISEHRLEYVLNAVDEIIVINEGKLQSKEPTFTLLKQDVLYRLGIDIPVLLHWFYSHQDTDNNEKENKKEEQQKISAIPITQTEQLEYLRKYCQNQLKLLNDQVIEKQNQFLINELPSKIEERGQNIRKNSFSRTEPILSIENLSFSYEGSIKKSDKGFFLTDIIKKLKDKKKKKNSLKSFNNINSIDLPVLQNNSTQFFTGEIVGIVGKNGAGKSTFVRCITNLLSNFSGNIYLDGKNTKYLEIHQITQKIGLIFQNPDHQLFSNTVEAELQFSLKNLPLSTAEREKRIDETLKLLEIDQFKNMSPFSLSGGQKKKIALASILCRNPDIIIFDEPTIGQDAKEKQKLQDIIIDACSKDKTIIVISHDLEFLIQIATRIIVFDQGQIIADDHPNFIFQDHYLLKKCHLKPPAFSSLYAQLRQEFPQLPSNILSIEQLERFFKSCR